MVKLFTGVYSDMVKCFISKEFMKQRSLNMKIIIQRYSIDVALKHGKYIYSEPNMRGRSRNNFIIHGLIHELKFIIYLHS